MSGHSKFANIAHKKAANDAAKGKIFTRLGKEIMVAVKEGGPDVNNNSKLRQVVTKCKAANMPNDTIERAIKKAASTDMSNFESVTYEGYGPSGIAIIVEALTDNKNRTASNVRNAFTKGNGSLGTSGCVSYMFDEKGQIIIDKEEIPHALKCKRDEIKHFIICSCKIIQIKIISQGFPLLRHIYIISKQATAFFCFLK